MITNYQFLLPTALAAVSLIWNYLQQSRIKKIERDNAEYMVIRKLQFETEFKTYGTVCEKLSHMFIKTSRLSSLLKLEETFVENNSEINDLIDELHKLYEENSIYLLATAPFMNKAVTNAILELWSKMMTLNFLEPKSLPLNDLANLINPRIVIRNYVGAKGQLKFWDSVQIPSIHFLRFIARERLSIF